VHLVTAYRQSGRGRLDLLWIAAQAQGTGALKGLDAVRRQFG
jgi:hypothetical protein